MKIKITKNTHPYAWYKNSIGEVFEVHNYEYNDNYYELKDRYNCILKSDTVPVNEISYKKKILYFTECPNGIDCKVGCEYCDKCKYFVSKDRIAQTVQCSWKDDKPQMKLNLRQLSESNITFRLETDDDRDEFWGLYVEQDGNMDGDRSREMLNRHDCWELWIYSKYDKVAFNVVSNDNTILSWTEIKEKYMKLNIEYTNGEISNMEVVIENNAESELNRAKVLLEKNGYKVELPYIQPTDEEICERIEAMNEEVGYVADWNNSNMNKYFIRFDNEYKEYTYTFTDYKRNIGAIYTTYEIAQQITEELNEKRFVRV